MDEASRPVDVRIRLGPRSWPWCPWRPATFEIRLTPGQLKSFEMKMANKIGPKNPFRCGQTMTIHVEAEESP